MAATRISGDDMPVIDDVASSRRYLIAEREAHPLGLTVALGVVLIAVILLLTMADL